MNTNATQKADDFVESTAQAAHETIEQLQASAADMADRFTEKARELSDLEYQLVERMRDCVRDHPLTSVLTAVAVGVVVAKLMQSEKA